MAAAGTGNRKPNTVHRNGVAPADPWRALAVVDPRAARGPNVAAVALANHNARVLWALLSRGERYRPGEPPRSFSARPTAGAPVKRARGKTALGQRRVAEETRNPLPMIATGEDDLMANRSDRRLPTLLAVRTHYHEAARMIREPGARISIRARAANLPPITQAGYMTATVSLDHHSPLACGRGPYMTA